MGASLNHFVGPKFWRKVENCEAVVCQIEWEVLDIVVVVVAVVIVVVVTVVVAIVAVAVVVVGCN